MCEPFGTSGQRRSPLSNGPKRLSPLSTGPKRFTHQAMETIVKVAFLTAAADVEFP
jgi:hypothetical protein